MSTTDAVTFALRRFAAGDGVLELSGDWGGPHPRRPRLVLTASGRRRRLAPATVSDEPWSAVYPFTGAPATISSAELVAGRLVVELPLPAPPGVPLGEMGGIGVPPGETGEGTPTAGAADLGVPLGEMGGRAPSPAPPGVPFGELGEGAVRAPAADVIDLRAAVEAAEDAERRLGLAAARAADASAGARGELQRLLEAASRARAELAAATERAGLARTELEQAAARERERLEAAAQLAARERERLEAAAQLAAQERERLDAAAQRAASEREELQAAAQQLRDLPAQAPPPPVALRPRERRPLPARRAPSRLDRLADAALVVALAAPVLVILAVLTDVI